MLLARQWVNCHGDAEDVVQDAFIRFWQNRDRVRREVAYLYQCVRTTAMNFYRSTSRRARHEGAAAKKEAMFGEVGGAAEDVETREMLERSLERLPGEQREVVVMHVWGELTFKEIGEALEIPQRTAQSRYRYGVDALQAVMEGGEVVR